MQVQVQVQFKPINEYCGFRISTHGLCPPDHLNNEVLVYGAALGFSHYLVHFMPIGTIIIKINQYLQVCRFGLEVFVFGTRQQWREWGTIHYGGSVCTTF